MLMPNELKYMLAEELGIHDLNSLVRTSREMNQYLTRFMYRRARTLTEKWGDRPYFLLAVDQGNLAAVERFVEAGADVNMTDKNSPFWWTAIHSCAHYGRVKIAEFLIGKGLNVSAVMEGGRGALHSLAWAARPEEAMATLLVEAGADVEARWNMHTPLHVAARANNVRIVQRLLDLGADLDAATEDGSRPLHIAAAESNAATIRCLLKAGQSLEVTDYGRQTPLHKAVCCRAIKSVEVLLEMGADISSVDQEGTTALMFALYALGTDASVHRIIHLGASMEDQSHGTYPDCVPSCLVEQGNHKIIEMLLAAGSDITRANIFGDSPLAWAAKLFSTTSAPRPRA